MGLVDSYLTSRVGDNGTTILRKSHQNDTAKRCATIVQSATIGGMEAEHTHAFRVGGARYDTLR